MRIFLNQFIFLNWNPVQLNKMTYLEPISGESSYEYKPNLKQIWISERKWQGSIASVQKKARHTERKCICWTNYYPKQRGIVVRFESEMGAYLLYAYPYYLHICTFPWIYVNICACKCMYNIYVYITYLYICILYIYIYILYILDLEGETYGGAIY